MSLLSVTVQVALVVSAMLVVASLAIVGRDRLRETVSDLPGRAWPAAGPAMLLGTTLVFNGILRDLSAKLSWVVGVNVTGIIYGIEGDLVPSLQPLASPALTAFFAFVYVFGYVFLLVFPVVAYLAVRDPRPLRTLLIAYMINYGLGLVVYLFVIAYGPRNLLPEMVDSLLYDAYPQFQFLTSEVNVNTNVFPSLHTSLSVTVALLAYRTRDVYRRWFPLATVGAVCVCVSTMYLGIHWAVDVVGGLALAWIAVRIATMDRWHRTPRRTDVLASRLKDRIEQLRLRGREVFREGRR